MTSGMVPQAGRSIMTSNLHSPAPRSDLPTGTAGPTSRYPTPSRSSSAPSAATTSKWTGKHKLFALFRLPYKSSRSVVPLLLSDYRLMTQQCRCNSEWTSLPGYNDALQEIPEASTTCPCTARFAQDLTKIPSSHIPPQPHLSCITSDSSRFASTSEPDYGDSSPTTNGTDTDLGSSSDSITSGPHSPRFQNSNKQLVYDPVCPKGAASHQGRLEYTLWRQLGSASGQAPTFTEGFFSYPPPPADARESKSAHPSDSPRKLRPAQLDLSSTSKNTSIPAPPHSSLATVRNIEDLGRVPYPEGVMSLKVELNVNAKDGKFR